MLVTFSLYKTLVSLDLQKLKSKMNIKKEFKFSLGSSFYSKVMEKVIGRMLFEVRL